MSTHTTIGPMCGIYGYITKRPNINAASVVLEGLKNLEYRGYDSAGIAGITIDTQIQCCKCVGNIQKLHEKLKTVSPQFTTAIGHTRWATHGAITTQNAHPHQDAQHTLSIVHNGILENYREIRDHLIEQGIQFQSETDSEVIAQFLGHHISNDPAKAIEQLMSQIQGSFAFAMIHPHWPDTLFAATSQCPLIIGQCNQTNDFFISSDIQALPPGDLAIYRMQDCEIAKIHPKGLEKFTDNTYSPLYTEPWVTHTEVISKEGYPHFMLKEIYEQPLILQNLLESPLEHTLSEDYEEILLLGCGSAYHAGYVVKDHFEALTRRRTRVEIASEFRYSTPLPLDKTLVIAISQSGETADTLQAVKVAKERNASTLALCNCPHSTLETLVDKTLYTHAGREISVCSTKAFTSQCLRLIQWALTCDTQHAWQKELQKIPKAVQETLSFFPLIEEWVERHSFSSYAFLGRQCMFPCALEGALKLKEISYLHSMAIPSGELKHGSIALIDETLLSIALCGHTPTLDKLCSNLLEIKARGGPILAIAPCSYKPIHTIADFVIPLPDALPDSLAPIHYSVCCQMLSYGIARKLGCNIDQPRNLAKSVTVD